MSGTKKGPVLHMFSEARQAFEREVREHHPDVAMQILIATKEAGLRPGHFDEGIAVGCAAAKFNIMMDGMYAPEQIEFMYDELFHKLRDSRREIII